MRFLIPLLLIAGPVCADPYSILAGDRVLDRRSFADAIEGRTLTYYTGGTSRYSAGGAYSYSYAGGDTAFGVYRVEADGTVCVAFRNGRARCDRFVQRDGRLILLTEKGDRFPVRP